MIIFSLNYQEPVANPKDARQAAKKLLESGVSNWSVFHKLIILFSIEIINN